MKKKLLCIIIIFVMICGSVFAANLSNIQAEEAEFTQTDPQEIKEGIEHEAENLPGENIVYKFVPQESGIYRYYSIGNNTVAGAVYYKEELVAACSYYEDEFMPYEGNFCVEYYFTAGETYYLHNYLLTRSGAEPYSIMIKKLSLASEVSIEQVDHYECRIRTSHKLNLYFSPEDSSDRVTEWSSSNPFIVSVDAYGFIYGKAPGTATVTVTTASGLTDSIEITVTDYPEIKPNEEQVVDIPRNESTMYKFVPSASGIYRYSSIGNCSVKGMILNHVETILAESSNYYLQYGQFRYRGNFNMEHFLEKGKTYYLCSYLPSYSKEEPFPS